MTGTWRRGKEEAISMVSWVQRGGPLAEFADGYRDELVCRGFTANSVVTHVVLMGQLSRWMAGARVAVEDLTPARLEEVLDSRRAGGQRGGPPAGGRGVRRGRGVWGGGGGAARDRGGGVRRGAGWKARERPAVAAGLDISAVGARWDRSQPAGLRDPAILLLLARLGLRSCEVARLELGDLDWRAGPLRGRGQGGGAACPPLPPDLGEASAAHPRDRRPPAGPRPAFPT